MEIRKLLRRKQVAEILGISPQTLSLWKGSGEGPAYIAMPGERQTYYDPEDLKIWIEERKKYPLIVRPGKGRAYRAMLRARKNLKMDNIWTGH